ncbi:Diphthine methyltransferase-like protein [Zancudomyces culisetae]|uniref:Diphthine methyltransferase-like protein n=1 Tax=Zancudomyces culisetae TaxID=1213189 RepID=A0A1R1PIZ7_ZANCU|nr:Diphthine methyltransferase-like protein [Zancudomyces culisetae]|eukprot:OMH80918.1 Diphthine methyltransferase-like protein [Zancudomyces culisetae]
MCVCCFLIGGDDGLFKGWDIRQDAAVPIFTSKFYDSTVNVWDKRSMKSPIISEYIDGSGIWRVKWHPKSQEKLLVAAMNSGICTLDLSIDSKKVNSINQFTKHQSLGYGADWNYFGNMDKDIVLSCSFYDKVSYLWESPRL